MCVQGTVKVSETQTGATVDCGFSYLVVVHARQETGHALIQDLPGGASHMHVPANPPGM